MKLALITGSCGLVGSESSFFFSKKNFKILGIDNNARKFFFGKDGDISWVKKNLKNPNRENVVFFNRRTGEVLDENEYMYSMGTEGLRSIGMKFAK